MTKKIETPFRPDIFASEVKSATKGKGLPPVHLWNPDFCGDIDMHIKRDGSWDYMGSAIARPAMVKLFSTILRHDDDGKYYLVTPVEKVGIRVDDAPFVAVSLEKEGEGLTQILHFKTNVGDEMTLDNDHPLRFAFSDKGEPSPYILVRDRLEALIARPVYYELAEMVVEYRGQYGVWSRGNFFSFGQNEGP
ncbi:MAG: DUF1285 domain-containing protein [Emcibacter sp.]|nr:DUF1285 domain-containing protein [Emcibacter sp.]